MRVRQRQSLRFAVAVVLLLFATPFAPARAEQPPGSGCDFSLYHPKCVVDEQEPKISCGVVLSSAGMPFVAGVRVGSYDMTTDAEISYCVTGSLCAPIVPADTWFILELEIPCGNGRVLFRNVSRVGIDKLEQRRYSEETLEAFEMLNDRTLLAMAEFNLLAVASSPYPVWQAGSESDQAQKK